MNSIAIVSLLAAVATLTSAAPTGPAGNSAAVFGRSDATVCAPGTGYFQNCSNGFRGCCKADACGSKTGCPDDKPGSVVEPVSTPVNTPPTSNPDGFYFACTGNGFRGYCKSDPCQTWCPDYKFGTYEPISTPPVTASSGKLWYVCASNGFRGECSKDACAQAWCPDYKFGTYEPISAPPVTPTPSGNKLWYVCASNGFRGECSKDPCALAWCPDYKYGTYEAVSVSKRSTDPTICAPGTGYFQSCSNGFRGCCKADACGNKWCPDYKFGTYEPVSPVVKPETVTKPAPAPVNPEPVACPPVNAY